MDIDRRRELLDFGPDDGHFIPREFIHELTQVRQTYSPEGLRELAGSMLVDDGRDGVIDVYHPSDLPEGHSEKEKRVQMLNPVILAVFSGLSQARRYIEEHAEFYEINPELNPEELVAPDGNVYLLVAGHRRVRAVDIVTGDLDVDLNLTQVRVKSVLMENPSFNEGLYKQMVENSHENPPPYEEARIFELLFKDVLRETGEPPTLAYLAKRLGRSETKAREAIRFVSLPRAVQQYSVNKLLAYSIVKELYPLMEAYKKRYRELPLDEAEKWVEGKLAMFCNRLLEQKLSADKNQKSARVQIKAQTQTVLAEAAYDMNEFLVSEEPITFQRAKVRLGFPGWQLALSGLSMKAET